MAGLVKDMDRNSEQNVVFDEHAEDYSEQIDKSLGRYGTSHDFFTRHKANLIASILHSNGLDASQMALLDIGCGVGKIHRHLQTDFRSITGVDLSEQSIEVARQTYPEIEYEVFDGNRLPVEDGTFDLTLAICVIHHVPVDKWASFVSEMLRVLRPGGIAVVIEHNPYNPLTRRIVNNCPLDRDAVLIPARKLGNLFSGAGAKSVFSRKMITVPPNTAFLKQVDQIFGRFPFGAQYYLTARKLD